MIFLDGYVFGIGFFAAFLSYIVAGCIAVIIAVEILWLYEKFWKEK